MKKTKRFASDLQSQSVWSFARRAFSFESKSLNPKSSAFPNQNADNNYPFGMKLLILKRIWLFVVNTHRVPNGGNSLVHREGKRSKLAQ